MELADFTRILRIRCAVRFPVWGRSPYLLPIWGQSPYEKVGRLQLAALPAPAGPLSFAGLRPRSRRFHRYLVYRWQRPAPLRTASRHAVQVAKLLLRRVLDCHVRAPARERARRSARARSAAGRNERRGRTCNSPRRAVARDSRAMRGVAA
jgi:hypothetical protein